MRPETIALGFVLTLLFTGVLIYASRTEVAPRGWEYALLEHHRSSGAEPRTNVAHWITNQGVIEAHDTSLTALLDQVIAQEAPACTPEEGNLVTYLECLSGAGWELLDHSYRERREEAPWPLQARVIEQDKYTFKRTLR